MTRMVRTQIQLTEEQSSALHRIAERRGVSVSALLREAADRIIASPVSDRRSRALLAVGAFASGRTDVSRGHDDELADAFR
jgi:predicted DNA-binding ribbon-helix-helix protein